MNDQPVTMLDRLRRIAADMQNGEESPRPTVREFLSWEGAQRRGYWIVRSIRRALEEAGLSTDPDFESAYIDSHIWFQLVGNGSGTSIAERPDDAAVASDRVDGTVTGGEDPFDDPTYRLSKLAAANTAPVCVTPDDTLAAAVTTMLANDFSQLPVMTSERDLKGIISLKGIGQRVALGQAADGAVRAFMDSAVEVAASASLFAAMTQIVQHDYVLVRGDDRRISGIVTASDLSLQFRQLTEPFLLLSEIENHIRRLIHARFSVDDLQAVLDPAAAPARQVTGVADLTFGEYVRLLQDPAKWSKLAIKLDRAVFVERLDRVRLIRNDVMHFDPDGIPDEDVEILREFSKLLQTLESIGVI